MTPVRVEPAALQSRVKRSTTEPLRSLELVALIVFLMSYDSGKVWSLQCVIVVFSDHNYLLLLF